MPSFLRTCAGSRLAASGLILRAAAAQFGEPPTSWSFEALAAAAGAAALVFAGALIGLIRLVDAGLLNLRFKAASQAVGR